MPSGEKSPTINPAVREPDPRKTTGGKMLKKYLPQTKQSLLCILFAITACSLVVANLCAIKNEDFFGLSLGGGIATIVIDYVVSDICAEVFGLKKALTMRRTAAVCNVVGIIILHAMVFLPADPEFATQDEFATIFTAAPIMVVASIVAYMCGTYVNDKSLQLMHDKDGEQSLFKRCILSTVFGGMVDTVVFNVIAYGGLYSLTSNIENTLLTYVLKIAIEVVVFNLVTKFVIRWAKQLPNA